MRIAPAVLLAATLTSAGPALAADPDWTKVDQASDDPVRRCPVTYIAMASRVPICT